MTTKTIVQWYEEDMGLCLRFKIKGGQLYTFVE